jgi:hypothetical protein
MNRSSAAAAVGLALILMFAATASAATPTISYSIDGVPGTNGWYRGSSHGDNVILHWLVSLDATSSNCLSAITIPGPTAGTTQSCWAQNAAGRTTAVTRIKIDATPPTGVTAHFSRRPDFHGWYNRPVKVHWSGADATSGIAACSSATYRGPDSGAATVNGGCTDKAGNSAIQPVHLPYDATPPVLRHVREESTAASDVLSWISSSPSDRIVIRRRVRGRKARTLVFSGSAGSFADEKIRRGKEYIYSLRSVDEAGNVSKAVSAAGLPKFLTLSKTSYVVRAAPNPILRWRRVPGAAYYNVQLFRGSKRIYSAWPTMHQIGLPPGWRWSGRHYSLRPAQYRWYVWAGFGARRLARYHLVGSARFAVPRWEK